MRFRALAWPLIALVLSGCAVLRPEVAEPPRRFVLEEVPSSTPVSASRRASLQLGAPSASPGFDTPHMLYVTRPFELQAFASHQWVDAPARMLAPLLARALETRAGIEVTQGGAATRRLDTEILRLQQEFTSTPSRVRFLLRAELSEPATGRVLGTERFEALEESPSEDPYGGVVAANRAVARVLDALAAWVSAQDDGARPGAAGEEIR